MKESEATTTRIYRMTARAEAAERTAEAIMQSAVRLWRKGGIDQITLDDVARGAGVSTRTVIRRFGSREGLIAACIEADASGLVEERRSARPGEVDEALDMLLDHYERDGDAVLRTLAIEDRIPEARAIAENGRASHRTWCATVFGPFIPAPVSGEDVCRLDAFVAATDLFTWRLFRRDLGRTLPETRRAMRVLIDGLIYLSPKQR
jgi:AcrR family transcriptional regulator